MEYRTLGRTGLRVSALGIGTWQLGGPVSFGTAADGHPDPGADVAVDLIRRCGDLGINLIDTAPMYGFGESERRVGRAIRGHREKWIVATKFGIERSEDGGKRTNLLAIREQLELSLQRLGTDHVDVYMYHCPPDRERVAAVHDELEQLKLEGKLRFHGISTKDARAVRAVDADVVLLAQSMLTHPAESLRHAAAHDLGVLTRGALEWGKLSGRYFGGGASFASDDIRSVEFAAEDMARYACFQELVPAGATMAQFAMRYVLDFDSTHSLVLGGKSLAQYEEAVAALEITPLDPETARRVVRMRAKLQGRSVLRRAFRAARAIVGAR